MNACVFIMVSHKCLMFSNCYITQCGTFNECWYEKFCAEDSSLLVDLLSHVLVSLSSPSLSSLLSVISVPAWIPRYRISRCAPCKLTARTTVANSSASAMLRTIGQMILGVRLPSIGAKVKL